MEIDKVYVVAGHKGNPAEVTKGAAPTLEGSAGTRSLEKYKPPILGRLKRGGEVVLHLLANDQQTTIRLISEQQFGKRSTGSQQATFPN